MTRDRKRPVAGRITPAKNSRSGVPRIVKRTTLRDEPRDAADSTVDEQVAALKKIPADRIAKNDLEIKAADTAAKLREALSENVRLTSVAETARKETAKYRQLYEQAAGETKHAVEARKESERQRLETGGRIEVLQDEIRDLRKELSEKIHPEKRTEYLRIQPDQVAEMISGFEQALSGSLEGLMLSNLELRLKVAVDAEEDNPVLILPPLAKGKIRSDRLSEFIVRAIPSE